MEQKTRRKKLGVIGGMGPEATSYYYENIVAHTKAQRAQDHIDMVILSHATMPDRTRAILEGDSPELVRLLRRDARTLEALGVSNIAVTCNTSHYFYDQIQDAVRIPVIHMIRESVAYVVKEFGNVKKVGVMATDGTVRSGIYHRECRRMGVEPVDLSGERQRDVMSLIYEDVKCGKIGDRRKFDRVISEFLRRGCDAVILACTELSVFKGKHEIPSFCLDAMDVLVRESILRSGAEYQ